MPTLSALLRTAHAALREHCSCGDVVLDATAGNGHDTVFLAGLVGGGGLVLALDRQAEALENTGRLLARHGLATVGGKACDPAGRVAAVRLIRGDHRDMAALLDRELPKGPEGIGAGQPGLAAAVFNLGFLPGSDKRMRTEAASTRAALEAVWPRLRPDGLLSVHTYSGHPGAREEAEAVAAWMRALPWRDARVTACAQWNKTEHPETLFLAVKVGRRQDVLRMVEP